MNIPAFAADASFQQLKDLGDCLAATGELEQAGACYQRASRMVEQDAALWVSMGSLALREGKIDQARRLFERAVRAEPDNADAQAGMAMVHQQMRNYPAAFLAYMKCLELNSDNLMALLGLFQVSCQMGTFSHIIRYLEIYLLSHPDDTAVLFCLATLQAREGKLPQARQAVGRVLAQEPQKIEALELLGQIERRMGGGAFSGAIQ
ncbi:MAG: tetratricopeptide repeat protein [Phycisphaerae bacterium]